MQYHANVRSIYSIFVVNLNCRILLFAMVYQDSSNAVGDSCSSDMKQSPVARAVLAQALEALNAVSVLLCKTTESSFERTGHAGALAPLALLRY